MSIQLIGTKMAKTKKTGSSKSSESSKGKPKKKVAAKAGQETMKTEGAESTAKTARTKGRPQSGAKLAEKTFFAKVGEVPSKWRLVDATDVPLGRLSSYIATALMGKDKPVYTRSADTGDHVIVINAAKVQLTGRKWEDKMYHYHTNFPGGIKSFTASQLLKSHPERLVSWSVYGMLPKGHMGRHWFKKLRVFPGADHPHKAQQPTAVTLPKLGVWEKA
jgi:large subunit ribosomal protein L13